MVTLEATIAAAGFIVSALLLGLLVTAGFLLPGGAPATLRQTLVANALRASLAFLGTSFLALIIQGGKIQHAMPSPELLARYLTMTQSGNVWLVRTAYGAALTLALWRIGKRSAGLNALRLLALLTLALVAGRSLMSHAAAVRENTIMVVTVDAIHLIATALWSGGLVALWRVFYLDTYRINLPHDCTARLVNRFSRLVLVCVALLFITGLYQSWIHVGDLDVLKGTDYGNVLMLKLVLFMVMLGLGALNFFSTKPRLARAAAVQDERRRESRKALKRIGAESLIGLLVLCATGLLTVLPPGVHALHQAALEHQVTGTDIRERAVAPQPAEGARVKIVSPATGQVYAGDQVPLEFEIVKGKRGHHVHAYIDGQLVGMFESAQGTLNGIGPGKHVLELRVVAADHKTELAASDRVEFGVK